MLRDDDDDDDDKGRMVEGCEVEAWEVERRVRAVRCRREEGAG